MGENSQITFKIQRKYIWNKDITIYDYNILSYNTILITNNKFKYSPVE